MSRGPRISGISIEGAGPGYAPSDDSRIRWDSSYGPEGGWVPVADTTTTLQVLKPGAELLVPDSTDSYPEWEVDASAGYESPPEWLDAGAPTEIVLPTPGLYDIDLAYAWNPSGWDMSGATVSIVTVPVGISLAIHNPTYQGHLSCHYRLTEEAIAAGDNRFVVGFYQESGSDKHISSTSLVVTRS